MNVIRISSINTINNNICVHKKEVSENKLSANLPCATIAYYPSFASVTHYIDKLKDYTPEEYNKLSPEYIKILRKEYEESMYAGPLTKEENKLIEDIHEFASDSIIESLNDKYGEDNWVVISLGRSAASIVNVIGYKIGEDRAKQLPMTRASRFAGTNSVEALRNTDELSDLKDYLSSVGLSKEDVDKSDKHYILLDYCATGTSLFGGYNLLNSELIYNDNPRLHSESIMSLIPKDNPLSYNLESGLLFGKFKDFSGIKKCDSLSKTKDSFCKPEEVTRENNLMRFRLLDNAMKTRSN